MAWLCKFFGKDLAAWPDQFRNSAASKAACPLRWWAIQACSDNF